MAFQPSERVINVTERYYPYEETQSVPLQTGLLIDGEIGIRVNKFDADAVQVTVVADKGINIKKSEGGIPTKIMPDGYANNLGSLTLKVHNSTRFVDDEEGLESDEYLQRWTRLFIGERYIIEYVGKDEFGNPQMRIESLRDFTLQPISADIVTEVTEFQNRRNKS